MKRVIFSAGRMGVIELEPLFEKIEYAAMFEIAPRPMISTLFMTAAAMPMTGAA